jgi:hypothetical protein
MDLMVARVTVDAATITTIPAADDSDSPDL